MTIVVALAYALGGLTGFLASRHESLSSSWRHFIRAQLLIASIIVSFLAAWRLQAIADLLWPVIVTLSMTALIGLAWFLCRPGPDRPGRAVLRGWSANPNTGFWVVPVGTAIAGAGGAVMGVLVDRFVVVVFAWATWLLRRHAPVPQRVRTSWIDQAPLLALAAGLALNYVNDPPDWTAAVVQWVAPVMAATGAAIFVGSVLHPSQIIPWRPGWRAWAILVAARLVMLLPVAFFAPNAAIAVIIILSALSIPAFMPPQLSVLYGYADPVVAAASRWGWVFAPVGIAAAAVAWHLWPT